MPELNFGKSEYATYRPPQTAEDEPDMVVHIPESGALPNMPCYLSNEFKAFADALVKKSTLVPDKSRQEYPAVTFPVVSRDYFDYINNIVMPWIEARKEWVVLYYHRWLEGSPSYDEHWDGAYALDDYCKRKILEAYNLPEEKIDLTAVVSTSPSDLEKLVATKDQ